jgi:hypothetical protein
MPVGTSAAPAECRHPNSCTRKWQCRGWFPPLLHPPFLPPMHSCTPSCTLNPSPMSDALPFQPLPVRPPPYGHVTHPSKSVTPPAFLHCSHHGSLPCPCRRGAQAAGSHGGAPFRTHSDPWAAGHLNANGRPSATGRDQRPPSHGHPTPTARHSRVEEFHQCIENPDNGKEHSSEYKSRHKPTHRKCSSAIRGMTWHSAPSEPRSRAVTYCMVKASNGPSVLPEGWRRLTAYKADPTGSNPKARQPLRHAHRVRGHVAWWHSQ